MRGDSYCARPSIREACTLSVAMIEFWLTLERRRGDAVPKGRARDQFVDGLLNRLDGEVS